MSESWRLNFDHHNNKSKTHMFKILRQQTAHSKQTKTKKRNCFTKRERELTGKKDIGNIIVQTKDIRVRQK